MQREAIPSDGELIGRFLSGPRDQRESAFELLVSRHGPTVLGICRRVLRRFQDAEDASQMTFLALARNAGSVRNPSALEGWLCEVAYRSALRVSTRTARHRARGMPVEPEAPLDPPEIAASRDELQSIVQAELERLPERDRAVLVHCYFEGRSNQEAARLLGWPVGTVKGRLSRARGVLRERLDPNATICIF
jgi:RNA polymerase sigma factor (sigma-70 family)